MSQSGQPTTAAIEGRLERLERTVDVLSEALRVLAHGVEGEPLAEPGAHPAPKAARQAYDLLLTLPQGDGQDGAK